MEARELRIGNLVFEKKEFSSIRVPYQIKYSISTDGIDA